MHLDNKGIMVDVMDTELARAKVDNFFSRGEDKDFQRGEIIVSTDSEPHLVYKVNEGFVRVVSYSHSGSERTHFIYGPGDLFPMGRHLNGIFRVYSL